MIWKPACPDLAGDPDAPCSGSGHQQKLSEMQSELLPGRQVAMWSKVRISVVQTQNKPMIQSAIKDMLPHIPPCCWNSGGHNIGLQQSFAHISNVHRHQAGIAVRAIPFICYPIGAQVAFLKNMHPNAALLCLFNGNRVNWAGITIKNKIGDR